MLLEFSISNIFSFKQKTTFSLLAAPIKEKHGKLTDNVANVGGNNILKTASIFGSNASGKTNIIKALNYFRHYILERSIFINENINNERPYFMLDFTSQKEPSDFEIILEKNGTTYYYSFSINNEEVLYEELKIKNKRITDVFTRKKDKNKILAKYQIMNEIHKRKMIPKNALFITKAAQFNEKIAKDFLNAISDINFLGIDDLFYRDYTISRLNENDFKQRILDFIRFADPTIQDIVKIQNEGETLKFTIAKEKHNFDREKAMISDVNIRRKAYDQNKENFREIDFNLMLNESEGTKKIFHISGPLVDTLQKGFTLFIDELDTKLHPSLVRYLIELFTNLNINTKNAQLIITSHNTSLLDLKLFRRDQIWFNDKNQYGESELYSLIDFENDAKKIRNDAAIEKNYLSGKFGAVPDINKFDYFLMD